MSDSIVYTGTFKTMQDVVSWINNYHTDIQITPTLQDGIRIAIVTVDGVPTNIYAPVTDEYVDNVEFLGLLQTGVNVGFIRVSKLGNTTVYPVFVPNSVGSIQINQVQTTGVRIADITVDGSTTSLYAPRSGGGGGSSFFELGEYVDINGNTVEALYELDEASGTDPNFELGEYVDINGNTVMALYEILED